MKVKLKLIRVTMEVQLDRDRSVGYNMVTSSIDFTSLKNSQRSQRCFQFKNVCQSELFKIPTLLQWRTIISSINK